MPLAKPLVPLDEDELRKFLQHVNIIDDLFSCWTWQGGIFSTGYGRFRQKRREELAHRISYFHFKGDIPVGTELHHICQNKLCIRPEHLRPMTSSEHIRLRTLKHGRYAGESAKYQQYKRKRSKQQNLQSLPITTKSNLNQTDLKRLLSKIDSSLHPQNCWLWQGTILSNGYGQFRCQNYVAGAHRFVYQHFHGPIPLDHHIHHVCHNRACVNPAHLTLIAKQEHPRLTATLITHCPAGHPYDVINTAHTSQGARYCRVCKREKKRLYDISQRVSIITCKKGHLFTSQTIKWVVDRLGRHNRRCSICDSRCPHGHPYTIENLGKQNGKRFCRECARLTQSYIRKTRRIMHV